MPSHVLGEDRSYPGKNINRILVKGQIMMDPVIDFFPRFDAFTFAE